jgi:outer membrane murein-binding lipoprotein Lpp
LAEHLICNQKVIGSNPIAGSKCNNRNDIMKYMLDIALVIGLLVLGNMWNTEKQNGLALSDKIDGLKANVAQLELDLIKAKSEGTAASSELAATKALLEQSGKDLLEKSDALAAKTAEADEIRTAAVALKARVAELEGYKAKAIVAEMPKPIASPPR